eukprot:1730529-Amphidinium_carterae.1
MLGATMCKSLTVAFFKQQHVDACVCNIYKTNTAAHLCQIGFRWTRFKDLHQCFSNPHADGACALGCEQIHIRPPSQVLNPRAALDKQQQRLTNKLITTS